MSPEAPTVSKPAVGTPPVQKVPTVNSSVVPPASSSIMESQQPASNIENKEKNIVKKDIEPVKKTVASEEMTADKYFSAENLEKQKADEAALLAQKQKKDKLIHLIAKNASIFVFVVTIVAFSWFKIDTQPENKYLSLMGVENVGIRYQEQSEKHMILETKLSEVSFKLSDVTRKLEEEQYLEFQNDLDDIKSEQLVWFDRELADGTVVFGMMDAFQRIADYFNDRDYNDPQKIVSGRRDQIVISDVSVGRDSASLSVEVSQILGRVFFLVNEFVDMTNSLPFYHEASIRSYTRDTNDFGDDSMTLSMNLTRQENPNNDSQNAHPEVDPADERFQEYLDWLEKK